MIPQATIDSIINAISIEQYIERELQLKKTGANLTACCPFHNEKTPSFVVSPAKGIFKCYGCGEAGNVIGWVMKRGNLTFPEAVRKLAKELNIAIDEREQTPEEREEAFKKESIVAANEAANLFFVAQLDQCLEAKNYCIKRWGKEAVKDMEIGYAPSGWRLN